MATPIPVSAQIIRIHSSSDFEANMGFTLEYQGKTPPNEIRNKVCHTRFEKIYGTNEENRLYFADNLCTLRALASDPSVAGKVRLVYIDPPFATSGTFESRIQKHAYSDTLIGSAFVESLRQRIILLFDLLAEDGSLYLHLDSRMVFHLKMVLDEIFGPQNFRSFITRKKCNPKNYTRNTYGNVSDYILFYTKSANYVWNRSLEDWDEERSNKEYQYTDSNGRRFKKVPIHAPGVRNGATGKHWRGTLPPPGKHWQYTPEKLEQLDAQGLIYWSPTGNPRRKIYLDESPGIPVQDIWMDMKDAHNQNIIITGYPTEKNPDLLRRIVSASSNPGDLVLDCYAGSGTTLSVASELGRNWIGVDNSPEAIQTVTNRFINELNRMGDFVSSGNADVRRIAPNNHVSYQFFVASELSHGLPLSLHSLGLVV
jgi:adenine-specific DNA-methyltransferase